MLIRKPSDLRYSDVTPKEIYLNRRRFLGASAGLAVGAGALSVESASAATVKLNAAKSKYTTDEKITPIKDSTTYNNFYEFGTGKDEPVERAKNFKTNPWTLTIEGLVDKPKTLDYDAIMKAAPLEERILRHRCVERWSIVVPWIGYSLSELLKQVKIDSKAKYVAFESFYDSKQMLSSREAHIQFPYVEGLRLDEAMNALTTVSVGMYGETLPPQNGSPIRLTVPWKYGFKSIKSITKIKLVEKQPPTTWNLSAPEEYGFFSNVNPKVDHPRWSQAKERRLGEGFLGQGIVKDTVLFNGYGEQVASLYTGMDLRRNY